MPVGVPSRRVGRPASATRDEALNRAMALYLRGRRIDLTTLASDLGVGRTTVHRWFGTRENLLAEVLGMAAVGLLDEVHARTPGSLLDTFDAFNRALREAPALAAFRAQERDALAIQSRAQPVLIETIARLIDADEQIAAPVDSETLAYAIVRLAHGFLFADATGGEDDFDRLRRIEAVLLGL